MKKIYLVMLLLFFASNATWADVVNGGFETGATGWTITGDYSIVSSFTPQFTVTDNTWQSNIPYYGNNSLLLGSGDVGNVWDNYHASRATQTWSINQTDIDNGLHLYFNWGAILEEPTNNIHADADQPYFSLDISTFDGNSWSSIYYTDHRANQAGFQQIGTYASGDSGTIWYGTALADINLLALGLGLGDQMRLTLDVKDCGQGGHGGLVFLDGFGTSNPVPIPAAAWLLGSGLLGLIGIRKKIKS